MANEYEQLAKSLLSSEQGSKVIGSIDKISGIMQKPDGKKLLELLGGSGGDALKDAARSAAKGDRDAAQRLITSLLATDEGKQLVQQVVKAMK
jgi:hypothetical protein